MLFCSFPVNCHLRKIKNSCVRSVVDSKYVPGSLRETTQNYQVRCEKIGMERSVIQIGIAWRLEIKVKEIIGNRHFHVNL